jgi:hypothetical protein
MKTKIGFQFLYKTILLNQSTNLKKPFIAKSIFLDSPEPFVKYPGLLICWQKIHISFDKLLVEEKIKGLL